MKLTATWNQNLNFTASDETHSVMMDTKPPGGTDQALSPKQLMLSGLLGCTAMDVVALLKKYKQPLEKFTLSGDAQKTEGVHPAVFTRVDLKFELTGEMLREKVIEAVELSQTKYCGVSAMLSKAFPIEYKIFLNGTEIAQGQARF